MLGLILSLFSFFFTGSGFDFEDAVFDGENWDVESAAAEIEDENVSFAADFLVQTVGDSRSGGLVDDTKDVHALTRKWELLTRHMTTILPTTSELRGTVLFG